MLFKTSNTPPPQHILTIMTLTRPEKFKCLQNLNVRTSASQLASVNSLYIYSSTVPSTTLPLVYLLYHSFIYQLICLFINSFIHSANYSSIHFIYSFIYLSNVSVHLLMN